MDIYRNVWYLLLFIGFKKCIHSSNGDEREIEIKYSKENTPLRDYYFSEDGSKTTTINGIDLKIYKYKENFYTAFKYNDYNFDIETSNITEQEFSNYLVSILK